MSRNRQDSVVGKIGHPGTGNSYCGVGSWGSEQIFKEHVPSSPDPACGKRYTMSAQHSARPKWAFRAQTRMKANLLKRWFSMKRVTPVQKSICQYALWKVHLDHSTNSSHSAASHWSHGPRWAAGDDRQGGDETFLYFVARSPTMSHRYGWKGQVWIDMNR